MRLITFGDSWVFGVGTEYQDGMSEADYEKINHNESKNCFRQLLSNRLGLENYNLSYGGSSNQTQFRLSLETFFGKNKIDLLKSDVVLWGITSVYRTELWHNKEGKFKSFFLSEKSAVAKILATHYHSEREDLKILGHQMQLWNSYFRSMGIKNYWFNVFNDHHWDIDIDNLLFRDSSLLSMLVDNHEENDFYHKSTWADEDKKIKMAKEMKLVNPISLHPTREGHKMITELLTEQLTKKERAVN